jgi:pyruvate kinase
MIKRTKIIATLGPASSHRDVIKQLIQEGANVFRLNFSHGTHESHGALIREIREAAAELGEYVGILGDLCGPKIRVGKFGSGQVHLKNGQKFTLSENQNLMGNDTIVSTTYPYLVKDVQIGSTVLLDDGNIALRAIEKGADQVTFEVTDGGILKDKKGMNLPGLALSVETITEKDKTDLQFMIQQEVDFVALSFVRKSQDLMDLRQLIGPAPVRIIAKIEKPEALNDLEGILSATDAVMIARGDLGVEVPLERVPALQKHILTRCWRRGILAITATQMLESMIGNQRPTRAETTDVFNAILDGSDAVMLSGETASGEHPVEAVRTMAAIAVEAEKILDKTNQVNNILPEVTPGIEDCMAHAACEAAVEVGAKAIVTFTHSGNTARNISKYHPSVPIYGLTPIPATCRRLALSWGVKTLLTSNITNTDEMIAMAERTLRETGIVKTDDILVIVAGVPLGVKGNTNLMKLQKVTASPS